jgi:serine/threonine-protein kinase HipA
VVLWWIAYDDDVSLLMALGGDTAGALQFVSGATKSRARKLLDSEALAGFSLGDPGPLDDESPPRLSLAGAQYKTTVVKADDDYFWPSSDEASTHILKFDSPRFQHLSVNEYFVMKLAAALSLPVAKGSLISGSGARFSSSRDSIASLEIKALSEYTKRTSARFWV